MTLYWPSSDTSASILYFSNRTQNIRCLKNANISFHRDQRPLHHSFAVQFVLHIFENRSGSPTDQKALVKNIPSKICSLLSPAPYWLLSTTFIRCPLLRCFLFSHLLENLFSLHKQKLNQTKECWGKVYTFIKKNRRSILTSKTQYLPNVRFSFSLYVYMLALSLELPMTIVTFYFTVIASEWEQKQKKHTLSPIVRCTWREIGKSNRYSNQNGEATRKVTTKISRINTEQ